MDLLSNYPSVQSLDILGTNEQNNSYSNLGDSTFSDLLTKQMESQMNENNQNAINNLSIPNAVNIADLVTMSNARPDIGAVSDIEIIDFNNLKNPDLLSTTSEVLTFFPSVFQTKPSLTDTNDTGLFSFERKLAATTYNKFGKSFVSDINDFVVDTLKK